MKAEEPKVKRIICHVCELCLDGKGEYCNVPGCVFCRMKAPEWFMDNAQYEDANEAIRAAEQAAVRRRVDIDALYDAIAHGDEDHRDWLKEALESYFAGKPVPPPAGLGDTEAKIKAAVERERKRCAEIAREKARRMAHYGIQLDPCGAAIATAIETEAAQQRPIGMCSPRDWPEDFSDENGNYHNTCTGCGEVFAGYKRRVVCKVCATQDTTDTQ